MREGAKDMRCIFHKQHGHQPSIVAQTYTDNSPPRLPRDFRPESISMRVDFPPLIVMNEMNMRHMICAKYKTLYQNNYSPTTSHNSNQLLILNMPSNIF